jgi:hypothetical protein
LLPCQYEGLLIFFRLSVVRADIQDNLAYLNKEVKYRKAPITTIAAEKPLG